MLPGNSNRAVYLTNGKGVHRVEVITAIPGKLATVTVVMPLPVDRAGGRLVREAEIFGQGRAGVGDSEGGLAGEVADLRMRQVAAGCMPGEGRQLCRKDSRPLGSAGRNGASAPNGSPRDAQIAAAWATDIPRSATVRPRSRSHPLDSLTLIIEHGRRAPG